ncbi:MAG: HDOD domain-containing protein [bacterium]|nr:HDOD domain-containing protein [bacterium]
MSEQPALPNDIFVARQPIFDGRKEVYAYELLYRTSKENKFPDVESSVATNRIITSTMLSFGLERLVAGRPAFINFDRETLVNGSAALLPPGEVVVEILEDVVPDEEVLRACRELREQGFVLALDDCISEKMDEGLLELAGIIKVDFRGASPAGWRTMANAFKRPGVKLLAEKVETNEEFSEALEMGYELFQGFFFSKPVVVAGKDVPGFKLNYLRVLQALSQAEIDFDAVGEIVKHEPSLVHKLLRYVNSARIGVRAEIHSIRHALTLLGEREIRKWFSLVALGGLAGDKPAQLMINSIVRGRTCELLAAKVGFASRSSELFLMGLFSLVDAILDRPMAEILKDLHLADDVRETLVGGPERPDSMRVILDLAVAYEEADWVTIQSTAASANLPLDDLMNTYLEAVEWSEAVYRE